MEKGRGKNEEGKERSTLVVIFQHSFDSLTENQLIK